MFSLDEKQTEKLRVWEEEQDRKVIDQQKGTEFERFGIPYYGVTGGSLTYSFTPTGLGVVVKIRNNVTKEEIDLTDYDSW